MTISALQARQIADGILLTWSDTNPDSYTVTVTEYDFAESDSPTTRTVTLTAPDDLVWFDDDLDSSTDQVTYLVTNDGDAEVSSLTVQVTFGYSYGQIDHAASSIRYTTLALVKGSLGIPTADTGRDDEVTSAILSAEDWVDTYCGRSFPDTSSNPELSAIPNRVKRAALLLAVAFYTVEMTSDMVNPMEADFQLQTASNMAVQLLTGFRVEWGVA
jgi:Phage gp6-like head-tail connector protein